MITVLADEKCDYEGCPDLPEAVLEQLDADVEEEEEELDPILEDNEQGGRQVRTQDTEEHRLIIMATTQSFSRSDRRRIPAVRDVPLQE